MNPRRDHGAIEKQAIEGLQAAIDKSYRRLIRAAKDQWERSFAVKDPSDVCVNVRVAPVPNKARPAKVPAGLILRRSKKLTIAQLQ